MTEQVALLLVPGDLVYGSSKLSGNPALAIAPGLEYRFVSYATNTKTIMAEPTDPFVLSKLLASRPPYGHNCLYFDLQDLDLPVAWTNITTAFLPPPCVTAQEMVALKTGDKVFALNFPYDELSVNTWSIKLDAIYVTDKHGYTFWKDRTELLLKNPMSPIVSLTNASNYVSLKYCNKSWTLNPFTGVETETSTATVPKVSAKNSDYPHKCPKCSGAAYIGFNKLDCANGCQ